MVMHFRYKISLFLLLFLPVFFDSSVLHATVYVAEPVLVAQPAYAGMSFYIYRPYNMPTGSFVTFDGYPVIQISKGIWVYGIFHGSTLIPTNFTVGSIDPDTLYTSVGSPVQAQISSTQYVQVPVAPIPTITPKESDQMYKREPFPASAPIQQVAQQQTTAAQETYCPNWMKNSNFNSVGSWKKLVDRMAVLQKPRIPLAWKSDKPAAVYAWTGKSWYQMKTRNNETPAETLKNHVYSLVRMVNTNGFIWRDSDTPLLANQAAIWGYLWIGCVTLINF